MQYLKTMKYILILILLTVLAETSFSQALDSIKLVETNKISILINEFNNNNQQYFKRIIYDYFKAYIDYRELDSLVILSEPMLKVSENSKLYINNSMINLLAGHWRYYLKKNNSGTTYDLIKEIGYYTDSIRISFRLYTKDKKQRYFLFISSYIAEDKLEKNSEEAVHTGFLEIEKYSKYLGYLEIPYEYVCFSIDNQTWTLPFCAIADGKIFSMECLRNKYGNITLTEKVKKQKLDGCDCDIDVYLTRYPYYDK